MSKLSPLLSEQYYTVPQLAELLTCSTKTLERYRKRGLGPPVTLLPGRLVLYRKASVALWLESCAASLPKPNPVADRRLGKRVARRRSK